MTIDNLYFVLNGLVNGEEGVHAVPAGSGNDPVQKDGWYYLIESTPDGIGPFLSRDDAKRAYKELERDDNCEKLREFAFVEFEEALTKVATHASILGLTKDDAVAAWEFVDSHRDKLIDMI